MGQRAHACAYPTRRPIANEISAARPAGRRVPPEGAGAAGRSNLRVVRSASLVPRIRLHGCVLKISEIYEPIVHSEGVPHKAEQFYAVR